MLSILIPTYNFEIYPLVKDLQKQCEACQILYEIISFDDGSTLFYKEKNQIVQNLPNILYKELPKNLGRAKIRNELGKAAKFPYLLFMDCDSKIVDNQYIKKYLAHLNSKNLIYGGRVYSRNPPREIAENLHYYYGKNREEILTEERKIKPYYSFMTNNFLISKAIFLSIKFEESIEGYGHEDTLFGMALKQRQIPIIHIENPLEHLGLEKIDVFLRKQQTAIKNLYLLHQKEPLLETKLLATFSWCKKWGFDGLFFWVLGLMHPLINQQLRKDKPNLLFLDLFKLHYLIATDRFSNG